MTQTFKLTFEDMADLDRLRARLGEIKAEVESVGHSPEPANQPTLSTDTTDTDKVLGDKIQDVKELLRDNVLAYYHIRHLIELMDEIKAIKADFKLEFFKEHLQKKEIIYAREQKIRYFIIDVNLDNLIIGEYIQADKDKLTFKNFTHTKSLKEILEWLNKSRASDTDSRDKEPSLPIITSGSAEAQGPRSSMEDAHVEFIQSNYAFFGVYDGHGGKEVADSCAMALHKTFLFLLERNMNPDAAFKRAYQIIDNDVKKHGIRGGCTAVTVFIQGNKLFVANAGDARAVLCRNGKALRLSHDHKPDDAEEKARIEKAGGKVDFKSDAWRVIDINPMHNISTARALGDWEIDNKQRDIISGTPEVKEYELTKDDNFIILACDGVWDVLSDDDAVNRIADINNPTDASKTLVNMALSKGTGDNVTVIVVNLKTAAPSLASPASPAPAPPVPVSAP